MGLAALCVAAPRAAAAGDSSGRGRAAFERGERAYEAGDYAEAIQAFREADEFAPSPLLSFDIGRCYERSGADREALAAYREYLVRAPEARNRADVERRIQALEQSLPADKGMRGSPAVGTAASAGVAPAVTQPAVSAPPAAPSGVVPGAAASPRAPENSEAAHSDARATPASEAPLPASVAPASPGDQARAAPSWWTWGLWGVSAASFAGAGGFELARRHWDDRARKTSIQVDYAHDFETMQRRQTAARVLLGVGAAAALGGSFSLYFDLAGATHSPSTLALSCQGPSCSVTSSGHF